MTYVPNQSSSKIPKILNIILKQIKQTILGSTTVRWQLEEQFKSLNLNSYSVSSNGQQIFLNLKKDQEYLIETYSNQNSRVTNVISNDQNLIIKNNFNDLYRGYATFYLEKDTIITININNTLAQTTGIISLVDIIVYGVK